MGYWEWIAVLAITAVVVAAAITLVRPLRKRLNDARLTKARTDFHRQRERLEAVFVKLASTSGKPRGLAWTGCDFENEVTYARDKRGGQLSAFVGVTISFAAVVGGGMEEVEAVGNLRAATAVFRLVDGRWATDGRALFNLSPSEAIERFRNELEPVAIDKG